MEGHTLGEEVLKSEGEEVKHLVTYVVTVNTVENVIVLNSYKEYVEGVLKSKSVVKLCEETALVVQHRKGVDTDTVALEVDEEYCQKEGNCHRQEGNVGINVSESDTDKCGEQRLPGSKACALTYRLTVQDSTVNYHDYLESDQVVFNVCKGTGNVCAIGIDGEDPTDQNVSYKKGYIYCKEGKEDSACSRVALALTGMLGQLKDNVQGGDGGGDGNQQCFKEAENMHDYGVYGIKPNRLVKCDGDEAVYGRQDN